MRIAIDAHMLGHHETGNETHIRELVRALATLDTRDEFFILVEDIRHAPNFPRANWHIVTYPSRSPARRLLFDLPRLARQYHFDLLHVTYNAPFFLPCPFVVTVHDVSYARHPEFFSRRVRWLLSAFVPSALRRAQKIFTVTEFAKRDLMELYHVPAEKIIVTPNAPGEQFRPITDSDALAAIRAKYKTSEHFILAVGNLQPRKNQARLIEAFAHAIRAHNLPHQLVIVGQTLWGGETVLDSVKANQLNERVVFTGFVPDSDLPLLYNAADIFVHPALYEGFGMPVLEAMACGTPVITSNTSSLPEIAGDAALYFDPHDTEQIAHGMIELVNDSSLRETLRARGLRQAEKFSWRAMAEQTLNAYHTAKHV